MKTLLTTLITMTLAFLIQAQEEFSLARALEYAQEHSRSARSKQLEIADADAQVKEYWAIGLPQVNASVDYSHYFDIPTQILPDFLTPTIDNRLVDYAVLTENVGVLDDDDKTLPLPFDGGIPAQFGTSTIFTWGIELRTLLFDGSFLVGLQAQRMYKELVSRELELTRRDVRLEVNKAYLSALIAARNKEIMDRNIENLGKTLYETEKTYEAGFVEQLDVDRLQLSLQNLQTESDQLGRLIEISMNMLKFNMGYPMKKDIVLSDSIESLLGTDDQGVQVQKVDYAYEDRIEYDLLERREELNDINIKRLKAGYLPSLTGFASYSRSQQTERLFEEGAEWYPSTVAGIGLSIPIFDGLDKSARIQRARITKEQVRIAIEDFEAGMELEVANARTAWQNAVEKVENRESTLDLAQKIYDTAQIKYREGVGSSLELSQAEQDLYNAQGQYTNALYDLLVSRVDLDKALGNL